jgi:hypothetical protein
MNNFVSSLISRSFTEQPALRPRATSLFEPAVHADLAHPDAPPARSAETPFANEVGVESEAIPNARHPATIRNHRAPQMEHFHDANSAASLSSPVTQAHPAAARAEDRMPEPVVASVRPHNPPSRGSHERESDSVIESFSLDERAPRSLPTRVTAPANHETALPTEPRSQLVVATQAAPEIVVAPQRPAPPSDDQIQTRGQRRAASASPVVKTPVESTVNVTIGTIEVRATTESKPAPRRAPFASPVMSLEDYLQRRQQGGNR